MSALQQMLTAASTKTYATWNPSDKGASVGLSGGDLVATVGATQQDAVRATQGKSYGKWYWEITCGGTGKWMIGIANSTMSLAAFLGTDSNGNGYYSFDGSKHNGSTTAYGATYTSGNVIGVAFDATTGTIEFFKNNVSQGVAFTGITGTWYPCVSGSLSGSPSYTANFGASAFSYSPPTGFNSGVYQ